MKKLTTGLLSLVCALTLVACSSNEPIGVKESENELAAEENVETDTDAGNTLVVYYSATGNTEEAANYIVELTDADVLELVPVDDYTSEDLNYNDDSSRVVYEHDNEDARNIELVQDTVDNWDEYDTVFVGYPIWWGIAAWPVNDFITSNNFDGKTVIPFATSVSSGLGESGSLLAEMAGSGNWLEGMRFSSSVSQNDVENWLNDLGLTKEG